MDSYVIAVIIPIGIGGVVLFALWFWAILDCIATDSILVRNLPKQLWLLLVIMIPTAGALAWMLLGRPEGAGFSIGGNYTPPNYSKQPRVRGIEDSSEWSSRRNEIEVPSTPVDDTSTQESNAVKERRLLEWEAELQKREAALDPDPDNDPHGDEN